MRWARWAVVLLVVAAVVVIGAATDWRFVLAPLLGLLILRWATATLASMANGGMTAGADPEPQPVGLDERVLYWCEECSTELLLVVRGSGLPPRHCGTRMHERSELLR